MPILRITNCHRWTILVDVESDDYEGSDEHNSACDLADVFEHEHQDRAVEHYGAQPETEEIDEADADMPIHYLVGDSWETRLPLHWQKKDGSPD
jgi:hypothetical protein